MGAIAVIGDLILVTPFESKTMEIVYFVYLFFFIFWSGAAIYSVIKYSIFIYELGKLPINIENKYDDNIGIYELGKIHLKISMLAIVPLFFGVIARTIGQWDWGILTILFFLFFALIIILFIFWPLNNIHNLMQEDKNFQLNRTHKQLNKLMKVIHHDPSSPVMKRYFELKELEKIIQNKQTWPFDAKNLAGVFIAIIMPIILLILDVVLA